MDHSSNEGPLPARLCLSLRRVCAFPRLPTTLPPLPPPPQKPCPDCSRAVYPACLLLTCRPAGVPGASSPGRGRGRGGAALRPGTRVPSMRITISNRPGVRAPRNIDFPTSGVLSRPFVGAPMVVEAAGLGRRPPSAVPSGALPSGRRGAPNGTFQAVGAGVRSGGSSGSGAGGRMHMMAGAAMGVGGGNMRRNSHGLVVP